MKYTREENFACQARGHSENENMWTVEKRRVCYTTQFPQMKGACFLSSAAVVFWEMQSEAWYGVGESACPGTLGSLTLWVSNMD